MILARTLYFTTILLGVVGTVLSSGSGNAVGLFFALIFLSLAFFRTSAIRIIFGVLYALFSVYIFLFTGMVIWRAPEARLYFAASAILLCLSVLYFAYSPLKLFLDKPKD
jgi:K+ transporter